MNNIKWMSQEKLVDLKSSLQTVAKINGSVKRVVIALHGFGDTAENFSFLSNELILNDTLWLFVQGPKSVPMNIQGAQWFPLFSDPFQEILYSETSIFNLIENVLEHTNLTSKKIIILGFSQGSAMALNCGLKFKQQLGGVIALSGFMIQQHVIIKLANEQQKILPHVFLAHGLHDQVVFPALFFETKSILQTLKIEKFQAKTYNIGHSISQEEILDIKKFIEENCS